VAHGAGGAAEAIEDVGRRMPDSGSYTAWKATQRREWRRSLIRDITVIVVASVVVLIGGAFRTVPNEEYPRAQEFTGRMDEVYRAQRAGELTFPEEAAEVAPGISGAVVDPPTGRDQRWAITGTMDETCYAMWWDESGLRRVRTMPELVACTPENGAEDRPFAIEQSGPAAFEDEPNANWEGLWPDEFAIEIWWWPLLFVAGGFILAAFVRIVVLLVTGKSVRDMS
jgi:hypothetical protein